jgi:hypothetical protein
VQKCKDSELVKYSGRLTIDNYDFLLGRNRCALSKPYDRQDLPVRNKLLFPGETERKDWGIPMFLGKGVGK